MEGHMQRVETLSRQMKAFHDRGSPVRYYHGSTHSTRPSMRTTSGCLDLSHLKHVLVIDEDKLTCLVEPNVPMDALVDQLLSYGLVPPVVPECPGITVGGAFMGTAGESSSFRHGLFDATVDWCKVILADGRVVEASPNENMDLFIGMKGTFGTLGVGVLFRIKLLHATHFVELSYYPVRKSVLEAKAQIMRVCKRAPNTIDFVDGIMFDKDNGVVITGKFCASNADGLPVITFHRAWDEWYYLHVKKIMNSGGSSSKQLRSGDDPAPTHRELVSLRSYLFRYDRGAFWAGKYAYSYFAMPFNRLTRYLLDYLMHTRVMYHALHRSGLVYRYIIQDVALPLSNVDRFYDWLDTNLTIYPLWLCPLIAQGAGGGLDPLGGLDEGLGGESGLMLNIGVWGPCPGDPATMNRAIETRVRELEGIKCLYAQTYYEEEEFWNIYDKKGYDMVRAMYDATALPDVYEKVRNHGTELTGAWRVWPLAGIYGLISCLKGGDYLRKPSKHSTRPLREGSWQR